MGRAISAILKYIASDALGKSGIAEWAVNSGFEWQYIALVLILIAGIYLRYKNRSKIAQKRTIKAVICDKKELEEWVVQEAEPTYYKKKRYVLTFQTATKKKYSVDSSKWIYERYNIGDFGKLTYKTMNNESTLIDFVKENRKEV